MRNKEEELTEEKLAQYLKDLSAGAILKDLFVGDLLYGQSGVHISKKGIKKLTLEELYKINIIDTQQLNTFIKK